MRQLTEQIVAVLHGLRDLHANNVAMGRVARTASVRLCEHAPGLAQPARKVPEDARRDEGHCRQDLALFLDTFAEQGAKYAEELESEARRQGFEPSWLPAQPSRMGTGQMVDFRKGFPSEVLGMARAMQGAVQAMLALYASLGDVRWPPGTACLVQAQQEEWEELGAELAQFVRWWSLELTQASPG